MNTDKAILSDERAYNILSNPCCRVLTESNEIQEVSVLELFRNAHTYQRILPVLDITMTELATIRLLDMFLCDIYKPTSDELENTIEDLLSKGKFDIDVITEYFNECIKNGSSFDLFGEGKAFAQCEMDIMSEEDVKGVGFILPTCKKVSNDMFYGYFDIDKYQEYYNVDIRSRSFTYGKDNNYIDIISVSFVEYFHLLCLSMFYLGMNGQGWLTSLLGNNVMCGVIEGKNVFETLLFNIATKNMNYDGTPFYKREKFSEMIDIFVISQEIKDIDFMPYYMTPFNYIRYKDVDYEKQVVRSVYFKNPNKNNADTDKIKKWKKTDIAKICKIKDPNVFVVDGKPANPCIRRNPHSGKIKKPWLKLYELFPLPGENLSKDMNFNGLRTFYDNKDLLPDEFTIRFMGFDIVNSSVIREMVDIEYTINKNIDSNLMKRTFDKIADISSEMCYAINQVDSLKKYGEIRKQMGTSFAESSQISFLSQCEIAMFTTKTMMEMMLNEDEKGLNEMIYQKAVTIFRRYSDRYRGIKCETRKGKFYGYLKKKLEVEKND